MAQEGLQKRGKEEQEELLVVGYRRDEARYRAVRRGADGGDEKKQRSRLQDEDKEQLVEGGEAS